MDKMLEIKNLDIKNILLFEWQEKEIIEEIIEIFFDIEWQKRNYHYKLLVELNKKEKKISPVAIYHGSVDLCPLCLQENSNDEVCFDLLLSLEELTEVIKHHHEARFQWLKYKR